MSQDGHTDRGLRMNLVAIPRVRGLGAQRGRTLYCDFTLASPFTGTGEARSGTAHPARRTLRVAIRRKGNLYAEISLKGAVVSSLSLLAKPSAVGPRTLSISLSKCHG